MTDVPVISALSFINDEWGQKYELYSPGRNYLYTGKVPQVGQLTETLVVDFMGNQFQLSGIVAEVNPIETWKASISNGIRELRDQASLYVQDTSATPCIVGFGLATIAAPSRDPTTATLKQGVGLQKGRIYRIEYKADDTRQNLYTVQRVTELPMEYVHMLPPIAIDFFLHNSALWQV
ncbi:predicted protein [Phaeodactylum tricornutum CCAP 1055/1]|jgi:hypothetical protein|uniref:Uncharacterized protein n=2 Tax=Phaeodactylum tricornutum TaxID=2850 RepID=B7G656_PHATC|nr:predicted protein [Phaeodactylum tricornutum CCAP 1055/1]EEC45953.1 predicted protein [Phaeodactylum tricornutum CCAP 1055/1]|eukprot:XP_002182666.1 predicted protein [Phaeodactylum tricornutum CCAP 1055/1]